MAEENKVLEELKNATPDLTEEQLNERELLYNAAADRISSYGLKWTFKSINFVVRNCNVTFNQLRSCVYRGADNQANYDLFRSVELIIKAGLIGSNQLPQAQSKELDAKANEIMEDWRNEFGFIGILHIMLINTMEKEHFFMGTQDLKVLELMSYRNLQKDLANTQMAMDLETKLHQTRAMQS